MDLVIIKRCAPGDDEHRENLVNYIEDDRKLAIGGNGLDYTNSEAAVSQMQAVTDYFDKSHNCTGVQMIVAFDDKVSDQETAIDYIRQIAGQLPDDHQHLYCVHERDSEINTLHGHILINPVNALDGRQLDTSISAMDPICDDIERITGNKNRLIFKRNRNK